MHDRRPTPPNHRRRTSFAPLGLLACFVLAIAYAAFQLGRASAAVAVPPGGPWADVVAGVGVDAPVSPHAPGVTAPLRRKRFRQVLPYAEFARPLPPSDRDRWDERVAAALPPAERPARLEHPGYAYVTLVTSDEFAVPAAALMH